MNAFPAPAQTVPWYREPWPWLLMAGPAIVVVAGFVTLGFAIQSADGLVADDYYNQGKAINKDLRRDDQAHKLGYRAHLAIDEQGRRITLAFDAAMPRQDRLHLTLSHPTRSGFDRSLSLSRDADGNYVAAMPPLEDAHWNFILEDEGRTWRLRGTWQPGAGTILLGTEK